MLSERRFDAVLITGSPFYPMLLAPYIKRRFGTPVVLDFQDPWVSEWGARQPLKSKAGVSHQLAKAFEPRALRCADFVTSVSDRQNHEMSARYPWLDKGRMASIPIGGDAQDFAALRSPPTAGDADLDLDFINLSFVGAVMPRSTEPIRLLFRAFRQLRLDQPALAARIRLNFVGTSNQPNDRTTYRVRPIAETEGVVEAVREIPQRLPYLEALSVLARSTGLLLIGSDEPHYTASKIYPGLMSGTPFVSLFHRTSSSHDILSRAGGGRALAFSDAGELRALQGQLSEALRILAAAPEAMGRADPESYAAYEACAVAQRFAEVFDAIS